MGKNDDHMKVNPATKADNNLDMRRTPVKVVPNTNSKKYNGLSFEETVKLQQRVYELEDKVDKLERQLDAKGKITPAPLKRDIEIEERRRKQQISVKPSTSKQTQVYIGPAPHLYAKVDPRIYGYQGTRQTRSREAAKDIYETMKQDPIEKPISSVPIVPEEKPTLWQRIKKAVKSFFVDDTSTPKANTQPDCSSTSFSNNNSNNDKNNQFRQNIQKTTVQIDTKNSNNVKRKEPGHTFDRYA